MMLEEVRAMQKTLRSWAVFTLLFFAVPLASGFCCCIVGAINHSPHFACLGGHQEKSHDPTDTKNCTTHGLGLVLQEKPHLENLFDHKALDAVSISEGFSPSRFEQTVLIDHGPPGIHFISNPCYLEILRI